MEETRKRISPLVYEEEKAMNPFVPMLAEIIRHLDHALSLDPETDLKAILDHVRVAQGYAKQATMIDGLLSQHFDNERRAGRKFMGGGT